MSIQGKYLIVGSDGLIGHALYEHLHRSGNYVIGATRRLENVCEGVTYLDLEENLDSWKCPEDFDVAVICASVTSLQNCRENPELSVKVNVEGVVTIAQKVADSGAFVIFLSTNQVFDGSKPLRKANEPQCPVTEYGRQKAIAEIAIEQLGRRAAIVRLTKVFGSNPILFAQWRKDLLAQRLIHPFSDMFFSPIPLSFAISMIDLVAKNRLSGITHVSGNMDISYAQAAYRMAEMLPVDPSLIQPIRTCQSCACKEPLFEHTTLDMERLRIEYGIEPPDVCETLDEAFNRLNVTCGGFPCREILNRT